RHETAPPFPYTTLFRSRARRRPPGTRWRRRRAEAGAAARSGQGPERLLQGALAVDVLRVAGLAAADDLLVLDGVGVDQRDLVDPPQLGQEAVDRVDRILPVAQRHPARALGRAQLLAHSAGYRE